MLLGVLLQVYVLYSDYLSPWGRRIWDLRARTVWERSGYLSPWFGAERTEFLGFVRENTSSDAVLLFTEKSGPYSWKPLLQYFLFPRTVVHCADADVTACIEFKILGMGASWFIRREDLGRRAFRSPLASYPTAHRTKPACTN